MAIVRLALQSVWNRRVTATLTLLAVAFSVAMLLGVEKLRRDSRDAFANTISDTDLIVGARSGSIQLLLYSVFRIGDATNNITWESYQDLAAHPNVEWSVPISLGDSHRGFRVMGTTPEYFARYRYANKEKLTFTQGAPFADVYDAVLGATVAKELGYALGDNIVVGHGTGTVNLTKHDDKPFRVVGVLRPTGTPLDRTVHVTLAGIEAIHIDWESGVRVKGFTVSAEEALEQDLTPKAVTAALVGLNSKTALFKFQRFVNQYSEEPLLAIIPGVALQQLWDLMGVAENVLRAISAMVVATGLLGLLTVIWSSLEARRREMAVLRSVGARPVHVFGLFMAEAGALSLLGIIAGVVLLYTVIAVIRPFISATFGLHLPLGLPTGSDCVLLACVVLAGILAGAVPAFRAYRLSLADGLSMRV